MNFNKKTGNSFETELCKYLSQKGYWTHNFTQNQAGQPADVIAVKNRQAYLIDCKVCENDRFPFSRIESNQHTAMTLWKQSGNGDGIFALKMSDGNVYMIDHGLMMSLITRYPSLNHNLIVHYGTALELWEREVYNIE